MLERTRRERQGLKLTRREVLRQGLAALSMAAAPAITTTAAASVDAAIVPDVGLEDIRSSQNTVLEPSMGQVDKVQHGARVFMDSDDLLSTVLGWRGTPTLPGELQGRRFIRSSKSGVKAICRKAGYVYAVAPTGGTQIKLLGEKGFKQLDFPAFQVFDNDGATKALIYQKPVTDGETLDLDPWVILIFGPEERGGVPYSRMRSLVPPAFLPDGSEFKTWEVPLKFSRTYYVDQSHPKASDINTGTKEKPFKTINRAAQLLQPGERVVVGGGVYRECVRPFKGGTDPEHMISYEAAPEAKVVIKGSELVKSKWVKSGPWIQDNRSTKLDAPVPPEKQVWMTHLPPDLFAGYNPFCTTNYRQVAQMSYWNLPQVFGDSRTALYFQVCGLLFQNGRRLKQVTHYTDLFMNEGAFWAETSGLTIHISPHGGIDPNQAQWEATAREQIFAPEEYNLGYIRVKGFSMEHAGNSFPFPQRGAISTMMGHHWIIEGNTIQWVNSVGIDIGDQGEPPARHPEILGYHVLRKNTLNDIGTTGITGPWPWGSLMEDNVFRRNAWHDIECLAECGAIKTHHNLCVLVRRNLVLDTLHGTGIYMDSNNSNSRICQNVVIDTGSSWPPVRGLGGIYLEATMAPNMVDHNFVWGSSHSNGLYDFFISKLIAAHNLIGNCSGAGIMVLDVPGRGAGVGGTIPVGNNRIFKNILVNNGWHIGFYAHNNSSDYNLFGKALHSNPFHMMGTATQPLAMGKDEELDLNGWRRIHGFDIHSSEVDIAAEFNASTLELVWSVRGSFAEGPPIEGMTYDFWNRPANGQTVSAGPFGSIPKEPTRVVVDPRLTGN